MKKDKKHGKIYRAAKISGITLGSIAGVLVLTLVGYISYCGIQYYRIEDNLQLDFININDNDIDVNQELKYTSFNLGFGAYSNDFSFFMDSGFEADGTPTTGKYSRAFSKEESLNNTLKSIDAIKQIDADFVSFQEVDIDGDRSQHVNQREQISQKMSYYNQTFAINYHSAYFVYPVNRPIGAAKSGLQTLSKYKIQSAVRKSYSVTDNFIDKMFDLDRCFSVCYYNIKNSEKQLVLINSHMSAYDKGGKIRNKQIQELNAFMKSEVENGNYVIVGGDFNHDLLAFNPQYPGYNDTDNIPFKDHLTQKAPPWLCCMFDSNGKSGFDETFKICAAENSPTCRGVDRPYRKDITYITTVDGFIVSNNIEVIDTTTTNLSNDKADMFAYSDHQPTTIRFKLKKY